MADLGYLTTAEAAERLAERGISVAPDTVKHWILRGLLTAERVGSLRRGEWRISPDVLAEFTPPSGKGGRPRKQA